MKKNKRLIIFFCLIVSTLAISLISYFSFDKLKGNILLIEDNKLSVNYHDLNLENDYIDLYYYDSKRVDVTINFDDVISDDKKVVIKLKEGLNFTSLPVMEVTDSIYQTQISSTDSLYNAIESIDTSNLKVEDNKPYTNPLNYKAYRSVYDEIVYNIKSNIKSVTISFNISSDVYRYYGETNIEDAIKVDAYMANENIGSISNNVHLHDTKNNKSNYNIKYSSYVSSGTTKYIRASTPDEDYIGFGYNSYFNLSYENQAGITMLPYYKYLILTFYCPEDTEFVGLEPYVDAIRHPDNTDISTLFDSDGNIINDGINLIYYPEEDNKVLVLTKNQNFGDKSFYIKYKTKKYTEISELSEAGDYVTRGIKNYSGNSCKTINSNCNKAEIVFYDNTVKHLYIIYKNEIQIWYPYDIPNTMRFTSLSYELSNAAYDDMDDNTFIYGPYFNIENATPGMKTNQTIEFEIPSDYQAIGVSFPVDKSGTINNIKYQIYGTCSVDKCGLPDEDGWYTFNKKLNSGDTSVRFTKIQIGDTSNNYYFKAVKGVASSFAESFNSGSSANKGAHNAVVFGNLKSNVEKVKITAYIYSDTENKEDKKIENYIIRTPDTKEYNTVSSRQLYNDFFDKTIVNTSDVFVASRRLSVFNYPYGNRHFLKNVQIYIREPKGVSLNLNNIELYYYKYNENNKLIYCDLISGRDNSCGNAIDINDIEIIKRENDTIYKINTNADIGYFLTEKETLHSQERYIIVKFPYKVDADCELSEIKLKELISFGNDNSTWLNHKTNDVYDFNNNGSTEDAIPSFNSANINIHKTNSFVVSSSIKKDGIEYGEYNEDNPNTIIDVALKDNLEYNLNIINNTDKNASFELYVPIPKKDVAFNNKFKTENITFELNLLEEIKVEDIFEVKYTAEKELIEYDKIKFVDFNSLDKKDITMIKISSKEAIPTDRKYNITINLEVDSKSPTKGQKLNIWNTVSYIKTSNLEGEFYGTKTALKLNYREISGFVYWDKNVNSKYDVNDRIGSFEDDVIYIEILDESGTLLDRTGLTNEGIFKFNSVSINNLNRFKLKIIYPNKNYKSEFNEEHIYEINESNNILKLEIPYLAYNLDFTIKNEINIYVDEEISLEIYDILPDYFNKIKHEIPYNWMLNTNDENFIDVDIKDNNVLVKGKKVKENVLLDIVIKDKFNNSVSKTIKVNILERKPPLIYAEDIYINIGDEVRFEDYIKDVEDGKGNKVLMIFSGEDKNVDYSYNVPIEEGKAIKSGTYTIEYIVEDKYGMTSKKSINIYVKSDDKISNIIPSTLDNIYIYIIIFIISFVTMILIIKYLKKIKKDYK